MAKVQALFEVLQIGTVNPQEVTKRYLEATEQPNINALMQMPEQGPSEEQLKLEWEKEQFKDESERQWEELAIRRVDVESKALKNIADAEAAEEGDQLGKYQQILGIQQQDDIAGMKSKQAAVAFQEQLKQKNEQHQQGLQQKDEAHRQKMAQQRSMANERPEPGAGGNNG